MLPAGAELRPLDAADVPAARLVQHRALADLDARTGERPVELTPALQARGEKRIAHLQRTDPDGARVVELEGEVVGVALALRRGPMWFLSLLMVTPEHQGKGLGAALLEESLRTAEGAELAWIMSSVDPAALRRYERAGFVLRPAYQAKGPLDRSLLPAGTDVRVGNHDRDGELLDDVVHALRGAPMGPEREFVADLPLLVVDDASGRGFAIPDSGGVRWLGASSPDVARRLLLAALAEAPDGADGSAPQVEVSGLNQDNPWAVQTCLDLRLSLSWGSSLCVRGRPGPLAPYLPSGAFG